MHYCQPFVKVYKEQTWGAGLRNNNFTAQLFIIYLELMVSLDAITCRLQIVFLGHITYVGFPLTFDGGTLALIYP